MDEIEIRKAAISDARLVSALAITTFYEAYFLQDAANDIADYIAESFAPDVIERELGDESCAFFIAEFNGKAVGYAKIRENSTADCLQAHRALEIQRIYLIETFKGKGVGKKIIDLCVMKAIEKGCSALWLGVWSQNILAQEFYRKLGFRKVGELQFPYGNSTEINFVMQLDVSDHGSSLQISE